MTIDNAMIYAWRVGYGLDKRSPGEAARWWSDEMDGKAPSGAVAALGLLLEEREALRKDAERYRYLRANFASVGMGGVDLIWDQPDHRDALDTLVDHEMRAAQFPGVDIDAAHRKA